MVGGAAVLPLTIGGLALVLAGVLMWIEPWDGRASSGGAPALPGLFPPFVMELETIRDGRVDVTIVLTYASDDEWLWEVFDTDGSFVDSQRLESGRLTITHGAYGVLHSERVDPNETYSPPAPDWFITPDTARGRGASRLGALASFEREWVVACGEDDHRCAPGETLRITQRVDYDAATGIPTGYTEAHNGVIVVIVRATRLTLE